MARRRATRPQVQRSRAKAPGIPFAVLCRAAGLPEPIAEYRFHPERKWRIDWAWPEHRIGLEVDGGVWIHGRHTRGAGWMKDTEKLNAAAALGFRMLRATPKQIADGSILATLEQMLRSDAR